MKIIIVNTLYFPNMMGGAEFSVKLLAESLVVRGHEVTILTTSRYNKTWYHNGVKIVEIYVPNIFWRYEAKEQGFLRKVIWRLIDFYNISRLKEIERIVRSENADIVHTNNIAGFSISLFNVLKRCSVPIVHTARDFYFLCAKTSMFNKSRSCETPCFYCKKFTLIRKNYSQNVNGFIGISDFIGNLHLKNGYFKNSFYRTIFNSVDPLGSCKKNTQTSDVTYGFLGSLRPEKGIELLLDVFSQNNDKKLIVAGEEYKNNYIDELKFKYGSLDNVEFVGFFDKKSFFSKIDVLIHPALWNEPFGRIVIEAFSFGIPVIATAKGGLTEIVRDKLTGYLLKDNYYVNLNKILKIINRDKLQIMSIDCLYAARSFSNDITTDSYIQFYNDIIENERKIRV